MAPGDREPKGRSMDDRSKMDRLLADGSEESTMDASEIDSRRRSHHVESAKDRSSARGSIEHGAIGYDEWMPKGLKNGSACVADADERTTQRRR